MKKTKAKTGIKKNPVESTAPAATPAPAKIQTTPIEAPREPERKFKPAWTLILFWSVGFGSFGTGLVWRFFQPTRSAMFDIAYLVGVGMFLTGLATTIIGNQSYSSNARRWSRWNYFARGLYFLTWLVTWLFIAVGAAVMLVAPNPYTSFSGALAMIAGFTVIRYATYAFLPPKDVTKENPIVITNASKVLTVLTMIWGLYQWIFFEGRALTSPFGYILAISGFLTYCIFWFIELTANNFWDDDSETPDYQKWQNWSLLKRSILAISLIIGIHTIVFMIITTSGEYFHGGMGLVAAVLAFVFIVAAFIICWPKNTKPADEKTTTKGVGIC